MRKIFVLLLVLFSASPAFAWWKHGAPTGGGGAQGVMFGLEWAGGYVVAPFTFSPTTCPQGTGFPDDGCSGATASARFQQSTAFLPGDYLNTVAATPADYTQSVCGPLGTASCRPAWNVACFDYPCGNYTAPAAMLDPATMALPGCAYGTSSTGGNILTCGGASFAGLLQHINFGPVTGAGAHGCTALVLNNSSGITSVLIDDIYFFNDTGLCIFGTSSQQSFQFSGTFSGGIVLQNSVLDGNMSTWTTTYGGCAATTICNPAIAINQGASAVTVKYSVLKDWATHQISGGTGGAFTIQFSLVQGWASRAPTSHSEWYDGSGNFHGAAMAGVIVDHTVILPEKDQSQFGPVPIFVASNYPLSVGQITLNDNVILNSFVGAGTKNATATGCIGATYSSGCHGAGHIFFETAITGAIGRGQNLNCTGASGTLYTHIVGPYPGGVIDEFNVDGQAGDLYSDVVNPTTGSTWRAGSSVPGSITGSVLTVTSAPGATLAVGGEVFGAGIPLGTTISSFGTGAGGTGTYNLSASVAGTVTPTGYGPVVCTSSALNAQTANLSVLGSDANSPYGPVNVTGNYIDPSSQFGATNSQALYAVGQVFSNIAVASGTITTSAGVSTLTTGATVFPKADAFVVAASIPGCGGNNLGCPIIVSGSGTTFIISPTLSPGTIGPIAMSLQPLSWCTVPSVFTGNIDMSGLTNDATMNRWSSTTYTIGPAIGC